MNHQAPVRLGIAGVGGFAVSVADLILAHGSAVQPQVELTAVCEPFPDAHAQRIAELKQRGVRIFKTYDELLACDDIEGVWLPVPIDLHRPFTEQALAAGKAVMCEKPATGTVDDLDAMIAARNKFNLPVMIGFQDVYDPTTLPLKRQLLNGRIGQVQRAVVHACWPRSAAYFSRSKWAGKIRHNDTWVLDSPAQNALAHYINISLFLLGQTLDASAVPVAVEAELYRAAPIENYDTISARVTLQSGASLLILLTHACSEQYNPIIHIEGDRGSVVRTQTDIQIVSDAETQSIERSWDDLRQSPVQRFARAIRGIDDPDIAIASLEVARAHLLLVNGITEAAPIVTVPEAAIRPVELNGSEVRAIAGIADAFRQCAAKYQMLNESHLYDFTEPAHHMDLTNYHHFAGPFCQSPSDAHCHRD